MTDPTTTDKQTPIEETPPAQSLPQPVVPSEEKQEQQYRFPYLSSY